ncbi:hypothetical protein KFK09_024163 [Dendrobium nobile]|uniref:Uncharacterized protein n=1 Tax=Dendrobium nobile TaxID=94219 RepID=A0A8T3AE34_DENNO|nr:hypothetical protein KFK09_024163 [Dendrobium nobile]
MNQMKAFHTSLSNNNPTHLIFQQTLTENILYKRGNTTQYLNATLNESHTKLTFGA